MSLVRAFELRATEMYARAKIGGYCHLNFGEEATVVGLTAALRPRDYLFTSYRDHGYALMCGLAPGRVMAELFGKTTGVSGGRGGSMHMVDTEARLLGGYGIVGGQIPLATGAALALTYRGEPGPDAEVVMCLLGDGATNIGAFHESLNLAGLWGAAHRLRHRQQLPGHGHIGRVGRGRLDRCAHAQAVVDDGVDDGQPPTAQRGSKTRGMRRCWWHRRRAGT